MSTAHDPWVDAGAEFQQLEPESRDALSDLAQATDGWIPDDRAPSATENNFMSFALFGFLILFGVSCFILF